MKTVVRFAIVIALAAVTAVASIGAQSPADGVLAEARQAYDATDYERALTLLDSVIGGLGSNPSAPEQRQVLAGAYELRARTRFNLKNVDGAKTDFRALLLLDPAYLLSEQVGARVLPVFEEVKKQTVGAVSIAITPPDAQVTLDDAKIATEIASVTLVGGSHTISASRTGYAPTTQSFTVIPGTPPQAIAFTLERISSTVALITSPANIEVIVDGVSRGITELDPAAKGADGALLSKRFMVTDLQNGRHKIEFRRECFLGDEQSVDVPKAGDYKLDAVKLTPAVATVTVSSAAPGATVFVDDAPRGPAPMTLDDICQGAHIIEVRTAYGRHIKRYDLKAGQKEAFQANVRPALAVISDSGASAGVRGGPDLRLAAETAFQEARTVTLFAPSDKAAADVLAADSLPTDWLAYDVLRRPLGQAATIGEQARGTFAASIARKLNAQGIAAVAREPGGDPSAMLLIMLAPGSSEPDVFRWRLDNAQSIREAIRQLDQSPPLFRSSIGVVAIDVDDVDGVVVASVERGSSADAAGIKPGDTIVSVGGNAVRGAVELLTSIRAKGDGQPLALEVKDRGGMVKKLEVAIQAVPNVVSLADQDLPANKLSLEYTYRAAGLGNALDEAAVRLNLAVVALRLRNRADALKELDRVLKVVGEGRLPAPLIDPIGGTAQYLMGIAAEGSGDIPAAERAWRQAAQSQGTLLIDDGADAIKELSEQRLNQLTSTRPAGLRP
jgi:tetratricopeptide (TPR) repeat protein